MDIWDVAVSRAFKKVLIIALAVVLICVLVSFFLLVPRIHQNRIVSATLWGRGPDRQLTNEEIDEFIALYKKSKFVTFSPDYGTTSELAVAIKYKSGWVLDILDFDGGKFEVTVRNRWGKKVYYCVIENKELCEYLFTELGGLDSPFKTTQQ